MRWGACLLLLVLARPSTARGPDEILVFAAASLTEAAEEVAAAFGAETGTRVAFSFGGSSDLARQIVAGAPADVFLSADTAMMDRVERAGLVGNADRREFLSNSLVVVVPANSNVRIASANDLLALPRLAMADPEAVPAGVYARKWLEGEGLWGQIAPLVVPMLDVRACRAAVETGAIAAGIVYATDAAVAKGLRVAYVATNGPAIRYSFAPLTRAKGTAAEAFLRFAEGSVGREIFRRRGFLLGTETAR